MPHTLTLIVVILGMGVVAVAATPINEQCPVTPEEPAEPHLTMEFEGRTIGFCCRACIRKFRESPEAYRANLPLPASTENLHSSLPSISSDPPALELTTWQRGLRFAGNLHVLVIHFPIALILVAVIFEGIGWKWNAPQFLFAARLNFILGAAGAVAAALLGWIAAAHSHYTGEAATDLEWHRWLGTVVAALATIGIACIIAEKAKKPIGTHTLRFILALLAVLIPVTAHFGATLIYGPNHLIP